MSGTNITIDDSEVVQAFNRLIDSAGDLTEVLTAIGLGWDSYVAEEFANSVDPYGNSWKPSERALKTGDKTLVDKMHLRDSYHPYLAKDGKTMVFGSDSDYAAIHQFGGDTGRNHTTHIDARPQLPNNGWPDEWKKETLNMISQHLENSVA